jgi:hypothetical protein
MATSQNGWPAAPDRAAIGVTNSFAVAGVTFPGGVKAGDVSVVLGYVADQFHRRVEALVPGWCWGWNYRDVRGSTGLSNHASGTAIDVNAPNHPLGSVGTFSTAQRAEIHKILGEVGGVVRWGGDYTGRKDEMHFEINASAASVAAVARTLTQEDDMFEAADRNSLADLAWRLYAIMVGWTTIPKQAGIPERLWGQPVAISGTIAQLKAEVEAIKAAQTAPVPVAVDLDELADKVVAKLGALRFDAEEAN